MKLILDTNAVSAIMKGDPTMLGRLSQHAREDIGVPQPVFAEIAYGIDRLPRSKRKTQLAQRLALLRGELLRAHWDDEVSDHFARIKATLERRGTRIEDFDAAIAAHALALGAVLVTADRSHMARIAGLVVEDWTTTT